MAAWACWMCLMPYTTLSIAFRESCVPHFPRKMCWLLACLNFSNCTLCSKSVLACLLLLMPLLLLGIFVCLSASCCLPEPPQWRLATIPTCQRLYSFCPFLLLTPCAIFTPLPICLPSSTTSTELRQAAQGRQLFFLAPLFPCLPAQLNVWVTAKPRSLPAATVCSVPSASPAETAIKSLLLHELIGFHPGSPVDHCCGICKLSSN